MPITTRDCRRFESQLARAGRRVTRVVDLQGLSVHNTKFAHARKLLQSKCKCRVHVIAPLFHTTSVDAGNSILVSGFKVPPGFRAFGAGVNLSPDLKHTMLYTLPGTSCTLVCEAVVGRWHENLSMEVPGSDVTIPQFIRPKHGFDTMYGAGGLIVVIPSAARVRPLVMLEHVAAA